MFKKIKSLISILFVIIILAAAALYIFRSQLVQKAVEHIGPGITLSDVRVERATVSFFLDNISLNGLSIGNPENFNSERALLFSRVDISIDPKTIFSETIVIKEIVIHNPEVTYEGILKTNNIAVLFDNIRYFTMRHKVLGRKPFRIDRMTINSGTINIQLDLNLVEGKIFATPLSYINLNSIGNTLSASNALDEIYNAINSDVMHAAGTATQKLGQGARKAFDALKSIIENY